MSIARNPVRTTALFIALTVSVLSGSARAENGVSDKEIKIGEVNVTSGPVASSGQDLTDGAKAYFDKVNREGGVHGRKLEVIHYDDTYEPAVAIEKTTKAIEDDKVFALINANGTPTAKAVIPLVKKAQIPYLFPRTGDAIVRDNSSKYIFNLRASFEEEMEALINYVVNKEKKSKIAILTQKDGFGEVIKSATRKAMAKHGVANFAAEGLVERNSADVKDAFEKIAAANPEVVVYAVTAAAGTPFTKMTLDNHKTWTLLGANNINPIVEKMPAGHKTDIVISQVVPNPATSSLPIVNEFKADVKKIGKADLASNLIAFEGYINAAALTEALKRVGHDLTRDALIKAFESKPMDLGGFKVSWSEKDHNGKSSVFLTRVEGNKFVDLK